MNNKTVGYVRVSTDEQDIEGQIAHITKYCELNNFELLHIVKEIGITGSTRIIDRPAGKTIQQYINQGATNIIAVKLDRMFRSTIDALSQTDAWLKQGVGLHILDFAGSALNTLSPLGRMVFTMQAAFAEMELSTIRSRTKAAMQYKKSKSEFTGKLPWGFTLEGKTISQNSWRPEAIAELKKLHAKGHSARLIADHLHQYQPISYRTVCRLIKGAA